MVAFIGSGYQWIIVLLIVLLLFGHRLPTMARSLGAGITEFKKGLKEGNEKPPSSGGNDGKPQS